MILENKLEFTLNTITDLVRNINQVALNASISAARMGQLGPEGQAFKIIASEILMTSKKSLDDINGLGDILGEVKDLSRTINIAGSLRMLSQKIMKLQLITCMTLNINLEEQADEKQKSIQTFCKSLEILKSCTLNTSSVNSALLTVENEWNTFFSLLKPDSLEKCIEQNTQLLDALQELVNEYEKLAG